MNYELIILGIALIITNVFWAIVVNRLVNKLMCRNYAEFVQTTSAPKKKEIAVPVKEEDAFDQQRARDLNSMMGL